MDSPQAFIATRALLDRSIDRVADYRAGLDAERSERPFFEGNRATLTNGGEEIGAEMPVPL